MSLDLVSDNSAGICPEISEHLASLDHESHRPYGNDTATEKARSAIRDLFECDCDVYFVATGTASNALALAACCRSFESVACWKYSHLATDECSAVPFFTGGGELLTLEGSDGKLAPERIEEVTQGRDVHMSRAAALSVTQVTEAGTCYSVDQLARLVETAKRCGLRAHMDGARFANAVATLAVDPRELTWKLGIDVLSLGGTKNGLGFGDAVVFFDRSLADGFDRRVKQAGHLIANSQLIAAGWVKYLADDLWRRNARHANAMAAALAEELQGAAVPILYPVEANSVFIRLAPEVLQRLNDMGWVLYAFFGGEAVRLTCSWATTKEVIADFVRDLRLALG
jgi:threonine aldolase